MNKANKVGFHIRNYVASRELVHSDVCGPTPTISLSGALCFLTFINDATCKLWVYPIQKKSHTFDEFQKFLAYAKNWSKKKLQCLYRNKEESMSLMDFRNSVRCMVSKGNCLCLKTLLIMVLLQKMN